MYANALLEFDQTAADLYRETEHCWSKFQNYNYLSTGITDPIIEENTIFTIDNDGTVNFIGSEQVSVYTSLGYKIYSGKSIPIRLSKGLYIVVSDGKAFKLKI